MCRRKIAVLMYHEIARDGESIDAWTVVRLTEFIRQMEYVKKHFSVLGLAEALHRMVRGEIQEQSVVITFDDGYSGNRKLLLSLVESMELPTTIFISTKTVVEQELYWYDRILTAMGRSGPREIDLCQFGLGTYRINRSQGAMEWREKERLLQDLKKFLPERRTAVVEEIVASLHTLPSDLRSIAPLTIDDVKVLAECPLVTIGAHSHCHNILTQLSLQDMRESVLRSKELLESWIDKPVNFFSYPNGDFNEDVIQAITEIGFLCGFTVCRGLWSSSDSPYRLPRIGVGRYDTLEHFKARISGAFINV